MAADICLAALRLHGGQYSDNAPATASRSRRTGNLHTESTKLYIVKALVTYMGLPFDEIIA